MNPEHTSSFNSKQAYVSKANHSGAVLKFFVIFKFLSFSRVVFPEVLNLNSFVSSSDRHQMEVVEERESVKCDDCSTADSGSADDESCQGTDGSSTVNGQDDNCADSDEGIDVSSGHNHSGNETKGPYNYELFSIMIHSGSASGGHYYAYIKDFDKNLWFCFNDSSVTEVIAIEI